MHWSMVNKCCVIIVNTWFHFGQIADFVEECVLRVQLTDYKCGSDKPQRALGEGGVNPSVAKLHHICFNPHNAEFILYKIIKTKGFISIRNHNKCPS